MSTNSGIINSEEEFRLEELTKILWRNKILVFAITLVFAFAGIFYAQNFTQKEYEASAIFSIKAPQNSGPDLSDLSSVNAFAGLLSGASQEASDVFEEITGADFLRDVVKNLSLHNDREFFSPPEEITNAGPYLRIRNFFLSILGIKNSQKIFSESDIIDIAMTKLRKNYLNVTRTENGAYNILVKSTNPRKAALIANTLMNSLLERRMERKLYDAEKSLSYLSKTLQKAKADLDRAQDSIQTFMLERNILSEGEFKNQATRLTEYRAKIQEIKREIKDLQEIQTVLINANVQSPELEIVLQKLYNLSPRTRLRAFNQNQDNEPNFEVELDFAKQSLLKEISRRTGALDATTQGYKNLAKNAEKNAKDARDLRELERIAGTNQLIFEALVQQLGASEISNGFAADEYNIYETAKPPIFPTKPNKKLIVIFWIISGFLVGCVISVLGSKILGRIWTKKELESIFTNSDIMDFNIPLYRVNHANSIKAITKKLKNSKSDHIKINNFLYKLNLKRHANKTNTIFICIANLGKNYLSRSTLFFSKLIADNGSNVIILDLTTKKVLSTKKLPKPIDGKIILFDKIRYERVGMNSGDLNLNLFQEKLENQKFELAKKFDYVITVVDEVETRAVSMAQLFKNEKVVLLAKAGQLKADNLQVMDSVIEDKSNEEVSFIFFK